MSNAVAAFGVDVTFDSIAVGELLEMPNIKFNRTLIDVTNHDSPGGYEEGIPSAIIRAEEFTLRCNSVVGNTGQAAIKAAWVAKSIKTLLVNYPDGYYATGSVYVLSYEVIAQIEDQLIIEFTCKWTGAVTDGTTASNNITAFVMTTGTLYPAFAAGTYDYAATSQLNSCTVTATFAAGVAKLYKNGVYVQDLLTTVASGAIDLGADGTLTTLTIVVTETGKAPKTYTIRVANTV